MPTATGEIINADATSTQEDVTEFSPLPPRDAINWFEIPSLDFERAVTFYEKLLDTSLQRAAYRDEIAMFPARPTGVGGAIVHRATHLPANGGPLVYLNVDGILEEAVARVPAIGGRVQVPVTVIPEGFGAYACIVDSEGNHVGLHAH
jgi:predicted enzyme related to lactoylglutathione lyase